MEVLTKLGALCFYSNSPGVLADVSPHGVDDGGRDEAVLDDEGVEVGSGVLEDVPHDVVAAAGEVVGQLDGISELVPLVVHQVAGSSVTTHHLVAVI